MEPNLNKSSRLEKIEQKLYSAKPDIVIPKDDGLRNKNYDLKDNWEDNKQIEPEDDTQTDFSEEPPVKNKTFGIVLISAILFFFVALSYTGYVFFFGNQLISSDAVNINVIGPVSVAGGETLALDLVIENNNPVPLEVVDLIVEYPEGTKYPENLTADLNYFKEALGDIPSGSILRHNIEAVLFGEGGSNKEIKITIEYGTPGSRAVFKKTKIFDISLKASPVRILVSGLKEISSGQEIELEYKINSNTNKELENVMVVANYPFGFDFESSDLMPTFEKNIWIFDKLRPNEEKTVKIKGKITGQSEEERIFRFNAGLQDEIQKEELGIIFTTTVHDVILAKPFVNLDFIINGSSDDVLIITNSEDVRASLVFSNNTNDVIRDLRIEIKLKGTVFDKTTVNALGGFYRSSDDTIIFSKEQFEQMSEIPPRENLELDFNFKILDFKKNNINLKNPEIKISSKITAKRIEETTETQITETESKTIKVISDVMVSAFSLFTSGPLTNSGPIPPKVNSKTTYTVLWTVSNNSNDLENAKITTTLPSYIEWENQYSPATESIVYDSGSRQLIWDISNIKAGVGFDSQARNVYLKLNILPSISQIGTAPLLLKDTKFVAKDTFTGTQIEKNINDASTALSDSISVIQDQYVVE